MISSELPRARMPCEPDLLNILLEAFHRWAEAQGLVVPVAGIRISSINFVEDLALVGGSRGISRHSSRLI